MASQHREARVGLSDFGGHCDVGQQHKLFHQRVGLSELVGLDVQGVVGLTVQQETDLKCTAKPVWLTQRIHDKQYVLSK